MSLRSKPGGHGSLCGPRFNPGAVAVPGLGMLAEVPAVEGLEPEVPALVELDWEAASAAGLGVIVPWLEAEAAETDGIAAEVPAVEGFAPDVPALVLGVELVPELPRGVAVEDLVWATTPEIIRVVSKAARNLFIESILYR